ncbi:hypothetical protein NDU88_010384 [Pleurodeles waltl]|uniref:Uncharacterized protein n=1 Tax=Pleurodeles waltl TaxID=8319 RepID=A0AAV7QX83_PLEWA|nr:hypothetical protein NDU88_010384 [Pleurodeles waltl]
MDRAPRRSSREERSGRKSRIGAPDLGPPGSPPPSYWRSWLEEEGWPPRQDKEMSARPARALRWDWVWVRAVVRAL